ncbi:MAG: H-NS histone family protein [Rubrivivax sp.]
MASVSELLARKAEIEKQIAQAQLEARSGAIAQIKALMTENGLTVADISQRAGAPRRSNSGSKVAAKYRDSATGNTWSGRGLQPKWLKAALAEGRSLGDFNV